MKKFLKFIIIMVVSVSLLALPSVLFADNLVADGDNLVPVASNPLALGDISQGASVSGSVLLAIKKAGGGNEFANSASVTVSITSPNTNLVSATMTDASINLPSDWTAQGNNTMSTDTASSTVTVNTIGQSLGSYSATVSYSASGADSGGGTLTRPANLTVTWTVVAPSDTTAPTTTIGLSGTAGLAGWYVSDVGVTLTATDNVGGSGVKAIHYILNGGTEIVVSGATASFTISTEGTNTLVYWAVDNANNVETPHNSQEIQIDKSKPTLTWGLRTPAANSYGWNNETVTIAFTTADIVSGVDSVSPESPLSFSTEGENQTQTVTVTDIAGNCDTFTSQEVINIDLTKPVVTITLPGTGQYILNQPVNATWTATDNLSGVVPPYNSPFVGSIALDTSTIGSKTVSVPPPTVTDKAGNIADTSSQTYSVSYKYIGVLQPINNDDVNDMSIFKWKSTIPVKFQLKDYYENYVTNAVVHITVIQYSNDAPVDGVIEATSTSAATTGNLFRYDYTANQYIFNLATKPLSIGKWLIKIEAYSGGSWYPLDEVFIGLR